MDRHMTIASSMLNRLAYVTPNKRTRKDHTDGQEVYIVAAHAGGLLNRTLYFTVLWQPGGSGTKYIYTYPASWFTFKPSLPPPAA